MAQALRGLLRLAAPLVFVQVNSNLTSTVDTALAGRLGELPLAAAGLGGAVFMATSVMAMGCGLGLDPLVAQAMGAGRMEEARRWLWQGIYVGLLACIPLWAIAWLVTTLLPSLGVEAALAASTRQYLLGRLPSLPPFCLVAVLRAYLQAAHCTRPVVLSAVVMNVFNGLLDWVFLFGDAALAPLGVPALGLPRLGVFGVGLASTLATFLQAAMLTLAARRLRVDAQRPPDRLSAVPPEPAAMRRIVQLGLPAGAQLLAEVGIFSCSSLVAGRMGAATMAAHQAALTMVSLSFAVCVGVGAATSVQVGRAVGARDGARARRDGLAGLGCGVGVMAVSAAVMGLWPQQVVGLLTQDAEVIARAAPLVQIAAFFQLADGLQVVAAGALRGAGVTRWPFVANVVAHWGIGAPVALALVYGARLGAPGLWWGLTAGLSVVAVALTTRFWRLSSHLEALA